MRVDRATHDALKQLARERNTTVTETVAQAVSALRQGEIGRQLSAPLRDEESEWLDAEFG